MVKCQARQHSDQMICHKCGLVWDMNDPEPPVCEDVTLVKPRNTILDGCVTKIGQAEYTPVGYRTYINRK